MIMYIYNLLAQANLISGLAKNLKIIMPNVDPVQGIINVLQQFWMASYYGLVSGSFKERKEQFKTLAFQKMKIDGRYIELILNNLNFLNQSDKILKSYLEANEIPNDLEIKWKEISNKIEKQNSTDDVEFWKAVGETLEPARGGLEAFANIGQSVFDGTIFKKVAIVGGVILLIQLLRSK